MNVSGDGGLKVTAADLFCGIGGLTRGLLNAGMDVAVGFDLDGTCRYAYEANNDSEFIEKDIREVKADDILSRFPSEGYRVLVGCAPCQPFSALSQKRDGREEDERWGLLAEFARLVLETRPDVVSMENVPNLRKEEPFEKFIAALEEAGYHVSHDVVRCDDYGVPQRRRRLVLLASKHGPIELIPPIGEGARKTVKDAIGKLPKLKAGGSCNKDPVHVCQGMTETNLERIRSSKPGGTWKDWDEGILPECFKKDTGKSYSPVYGRMKWDKPAPTITTQFFNYGSGRFGHPVQDRALSLREGAILQSFPKDYKLVRKGENAILTTIGIHIGNAVPVKLGEAIGKSIIKHLCLIDKASNCP